MKIALIVLSIISLVIGFTGGWNDHPDVLWVGFLSFVILIFTSHLDQIAEFKATGKGIEAKTREVISKAETTVTELQSMVTIFAEMILSSIKRSGRLGGFSDEEETAVKDKVLNVLKELKIAQDEQDAVLADWHKFTKFDYAHFILGRQIPSGFDDDKSIRSEWETMREIEEIPSPEQLRKFLKKWNVLTLEREELLIDYQYYIDNGEHRRPLVWSDRLNWGYIQPIN